MAEPKKQSNSKLLLIALVLGAVAVGLFYMYSSIQEERLSGDRVWVLKWNRDRRAGDEVLTSDVQRVEMPRSAINNIDTVMKDTEEDKVRINKNHVTRAVEKDRFVYYDEFKESGIRNPSFHIRMGMRAYPLPIDPVVSLGALMRVDDRVDLIGVVAPKGRPARAYTLIGNLRVLAVGGRPEEQDFGFFSAERSRKTDAYAVTYRTVSVEVSQEVAERLTDLLPRVQGPLRVVVRNAMDTGGLPEGKINPDVESVLTMPAPETPGN